MLSEVSRLANDIQAAIEDHRDVSLSVALRKAVRLAQLRDDTEWRLLFQLHIDGMTVDGSPKSSLQKWPDVSRPPAWSFIDAFFEDRSAEIGQAQGFPLETLEGLIDTFRRERGRTGLSGPQLGELLKQEVKIVDVINRIRIRVAAYATQVQMHIQETNAATRPVVDGPTAASQVFIGHGNSRIWTVLKDFLQDRLGLEWDEFNRESTAGLTTIERLQSMLMTARFAFLVLTAEDEHADGSLHARENVIHEAGLFQGKLGFRRAILLIEEGCAEFSNVHGLTQIRFPRGNILAKSEEIRRVLEREGILDRQA